MADIKWHLKGRNFSHCNCSYGCPCQFNALPTHGNCEAVVGIVIDEGNHGGTKLDGLKILETLRAQKNAVPVMILSALADVDERVKGLKAGGDARLWDPDVEHVGRFARLQARMGIDHQSR